MISPTDVRIRDEAARASAATESTLRARISALEAELASQRDLFDQRSRVREHDLILTHREEMMAVRSALADRDNCIRELQHQQVLSQEEIARLRERLRHSSAGASSSHAVPESHQATLGLVPRGMSQESFSSTLRFLLAHPMSGILSGSPGSPSVGFPGGQSAPDPAPSASTDPPPATQPSQPSQPDQDSQE